MVVRSQYRRKVGDERGVSRSPFSARVGLAVRHENITRDAWITVATRSLNKRKRDFVFWSVSFFKILAKGLVTCFWVITGLYLPALRSFYVSSSKSSPINHMPEYMFL